MSLTEKILEASLKEVSSKVKGTELNIRAQRELCKKGFSFSGLPVKNQILIWDKVWKSEVSFWMKLQAFLL